ncbi:RNA-binding protein Vts1p [[Candida] railenensis]|uniref:RNA-binding protein VTS1 n=1 Tax=[Candida] railenensis TaxID=45579 RepID=A0A9P0QNW3_9ASCO|nr:RNA-binding protein Vts1p [[Candida] railenensis]
MPSPPFDIVLSPPPLDGQSLNISENLQQQQQQQQQSHSQQQSQNSSQQQQPPYHQQRQQSVGYNLQHEFETLNHDLDLDLTNNISNPRPELSNMRSSQYSSFVTPATSSLLRDTTLSPSPSAASSNAGLASLLNSSASANFLPPLASIPNRPQSVQDFSFSSYNHTSQPQPQHLHSSGQQQAQSHPSGQSSQLSSNLYQPTSSQFYSDLLTFGHWIENLSSSDTNTMMDHLINTLPLDVLSLFKTKLEAHLNPYAGLSYDLDRISLDDQNNQHQHSHLQQQQQQHNLVGGARGIPQYSTLQQPKPKPNYRVFDKSRPKSADPHTRNFLDRARSPNAHLYEKTNFLQLAAGSNQVPPQSNSSNGQGSNNIANGGGNVSQSLTSNNHGNSQDDLSGQAALKLGALATINSRVALDSNRKNFRNYESQIGRYVNSSSVPVPPQGGSQGPRSNHQQFQNQIPNQNQNQIQNQTQTQTQIQGQNQRQSYPGRSSTPTSTLDMSSPLTPTASASSANASSSSMPADIANLELLNNIPTWLKLLRLHKYTDCLKDIPWQELIELSDHDLEEKGVKALGARRKLLKAFDAVKQTMG